MNKSTISILIVLAILLSGCATKQTTSVSTSSVSIELDLRNTASAIEPKQTPTSVKDTTASVEDFEYQDKVVQQAGKIVVAEEPTQSTVTNNTTVVTPIDALQTSEKYYIAWTIDNYEIKVDCSSEQYTNIEIRQNYPTTTYHVVLSQDKIFYAEGTEVYAYTPTPEDITKLSFDIGTPRDTETSGAYRACKADACFMGNVYEDVNAYVMGQYLYKWEVNGQEYYVRALQLEPINEFYNTEVTDCKDDVYPKIDDLLRVIGVKR